MTFRDLGSYGLRQYSGWIRDEFLPQLQGRQAARVYREMAENQAVVGSILFAIIQAMRSVTWRETSGTDKAGSAEAVAFANSLRHDMTETWEEVVAEGLTMLQYGFAPLEIVYKRRTGKKQPAGAPRSKYDDGKVGWRRLPIRGQDTVLKWFFDDNGQVTGLTQQPWTGALIDIPIEKLLLLRPRSHKNNPEGISILRTAYRSHYMIKRLEEMEAILFERLSGFPVIYLPQEIITGALATNPDPNAVKVYNAYKEAISNIRINQQMGMLLPSTTYPGENGGPSSVRMYDFQLVTPQSGHIVDPGPIIERYKLDILKSVLADFIDLGHQARGTQNLAITKIDMFYQAIEGWLHSMSEVLNRYGLSRIWDLNAFDRDLMPEYAPDMPQRVDLTALGGYVADLFASGINMSDDPEVHDYLREQAGIPRLTPERYKEILEQPAAKPDEDEQGGPSKTPTQRAATAIAKGMLGMAMEKARRRVPMQSISATKAAPIPPRVGDFVSIESDLGDASNAPWTSKVRAADGWKVRVDYDDGEHEYKLDPDDLAGLVRGPKGSRHLRFSKMPLMNGHDTTAHA